MMILAIGARMSGEPASQTSQGCFATGIVFLMGLAMAANSAIDGSRDKQTSQTAAQATHYSQTVTTVAPQKTQNCIRCGKNIGSDFMICPYCGLALRPTCPSCGKQVEADYSFCPFCKAVLRPIQTGVPQTQNAQGTINAPSVQQPYTPPQSQAVQQFPQQLQK